MSEQTKEYMEGWNAASQGKSSLDNPYGYDEWHMLEWSTGFHEYCMEYDI